MINTRTCYTGTCMPLAGFPPVCTGCVCEEAMDDAGEPKADVFMIGHTKSCAEDKVYHVDINMYVYTCSKQDIHVYKYIQ